MQDENDPKQCVNLSSKDGNTCNTVYPEENVVSHTKHGDMRPEARRNIVYKDMCRELMPTSGHLKSDFFLLCHPPPPPLPHLSKNRPRPHQISVSIHDRLGER